MNNPLPLLVSIIIPIYNSENYLNKCLDSVILQTHQKLEIILVNDGSTDSSKDIIDNFAAKDKRIVTIHKENGGIGSAYKVAFEVMSGDYVLFVDSDDWLELGAVESLVELAQENDADMVSFAIRAFNPQGEEVDLPSFKNIDLINTTNVAVLKTHFEVLKHPTLVRLYKRELFENIIVFEQNIGIDEMLTPQLLAKCNRAVYTSKVFYNVLVRQDSVCRSSYTKAKIDQTHRVYDFLLDYSSNHIEQYHYIYVHKYLQVLNGMLLETGQGDIAFSKKDLTDLIVRIKMNLDMFLKVKEKQQYNNLLLYKIFLTAKFPGLSIRTMKYYNKLRRISK